MNYAAEGASIRASTGAFAACIPFLPLPLSSFRHILLPYNSLYINEAGIYARTLEYSVEKAFENVGNLQFVS